MQVMPWPSSEWRGA